MQVAGVKAQMQEARYTGEAMRQVEEYNAAVLRQQADLIRKSGELDIARQRKQAVAFKARQKALYAKAGVLLEGSPFEVIVDSAAEAELDIGITKYNTEIAALRAESQARYHEYLGKEYYREGEEAYKAGGIQMGSILLASASELVTKYGGILLPKKVKPLS